MIRLDDMALFVEVVRARSFRRAAASLGMPNSTLSRRVSELEKSIGLRLLHRSTRKIEITEAGQLYFERCKKIIEEARVAHEQLDTMLVQPRGLLRASLPVDFATTYLAPLIAEFSETYPDIQFEFDLTPRNVDLVSEPFDVAIRIGNPVDSPLIARQLAILTPSLYAAPAYMATHGEPREPADLAKHECLDFPGATQWSLRREEENVTVQVSGRFHVNSQGMIRKLAVLGLGIALLPSGLAAEDVSAGRLRPIMTDWQGNRMPVYALTETRLLPARTQLFVEFLRKKLKRL